MRTIDKVNYYLAKRGKTGADLSRALGLSNSIYSQWNTGKSKPSKNKLPAIADFLNVSVNDLLPDSERPPMPEDGAKKAPTDKIDERVLDAALFSRLRQLTPDEVRRVDDFVQGILATHKE